MRTTSPKKSVAYRALAAVGRLASRIIWGLGKLVDKGFYAVADRAMDYHLDRQDRLAMEVPEYAEIEERRRNNGTPYITLASEKDNLGWAEMELQADIREDVAPTPWWFGIARFFRNRPIASGLGSVRLASQRVTRGWDDRSLWSLDDSLCKTLGAQLTALADTTHGWPGGDKYPEYEDWTAALRKHGAALTAYPTRWELDLDDSLTPEVRNKKNDKIVADAKRAFRFVAENLQSLWD